MNNNIDFELNHIKKKYYDLILNDLQNGWTEYLEDCTMHQWLEDEWNEIDSNNEYEWYNHCWKEWINYNYNIQKEHYISKIEQNIWDDILYEDIKKKKILIYIILISLGYYITN